MATKTRTRLAADAVAPKPAGKNNGPIPYGFTASALQIRIAYYVRFNRQLPGGTYESAALEIINSLPIGMGTAFILAIPNDADSDLSKALPSYVPPAV